MELTENFDMDFTGDKTGHVIKINIFFICMAALYETICPRTICAASSMEDTDGKVLQSPLKLYGKNIMCALECFVKPSWKYKSGSQGQSNIMMPEQVGRALLLEGFFSPIPALTANCVYKNQGYVSLASLIPCPSSNTFQTTNMQGDKGCETPYSNTVIFVYHLHTALQSRIKEAEVGLIPIP